MPDTTYIYALKELAHGEFFSTRIRYVGKSNDPFQRFEEHPRTSERCHRGCWIRSLPARGLSLQLEILDEVPESEWEFWEREYIKVFRAIGFNLVNTTEGGEGIGKVSDETRKKMSVAKSGSRHPNFGRPLSSGIREKISRANSGKKRTAESCERIRLSQLGRILSPEMKEKIGLSLRGKAHKDNTSGFVGVFFARHRNGWMASIGVKGVEIRLGCFPRIEDAVAARKMAEQKYYGSD